MHAVEAASLLLLALGAFTIPLVSGRIGIPSAVGEIVFGILIGPHVLGILHESGFTEFLSEFGFALLMFLAGLELQFSRIEREGLFGILAAAVVPVLVFVLGFLATVILRLPVYLFLGLGAMSLGILLVTLSDAGMTRTRAGQAIILAASIGEFLTIVLLTAVSLTYRFGIGWKLVLEMAKLGSIFVAAYFVLVVLRTVIWWVPGRFTRLVAARDPSEVGVRAGMAMMMVFVALALLVGVEAILGSFIAGALFSFVFREKQILETKLASMAFGFFVPIFFISVGARFDLGAVARLDVLPLLLLLVLASLGVKVVSSLPLLTRGLTLRECVGAGLLLGAPLTLLVVISRIGLEIEVLDQRTAGALVLLAITSSILFPWLFKRIARR